jgi:hypothetical protein
MRKVLYRTVFETVVGKGLTPLPPRQGCGGGGWCQTPNQQACVAGGGWCQTPNQRLALWGRRLVSDTKSTACAAEAVGVRHRINRACATAAVDVRHRINRACATGAVGVRHRINGLRCGGRLVSDTESTGLALRGQLVSDTESTACAMGQAVGVRHQINRACATGAVGVRHRINGLRCGRRLVSGILYSSVSVLPFMGCETNTFIPPPARPRLPAVRLSPAPPRRAA